MRALILICGLLAMPPGLPTALAQAPEEPMAGFERLIGGCWRLGDTCQEFRWGLEGRHLLSRAVVRTGDGEQVVSEGAWFYHPGAGAVAGYFVARGMGVDLFEYRTRFEGEVMISQVTAWGPDGQSRRYEERWTFTDADRYRWELYEEKEGGPVPVMDGVFQRETRAGDDRQGD